MVLAAGRGERMEPLSSWVPKPALEVLGRPLLASALDHLVAARCAPIVVNLHRHPAAVAAAARAHEPAGTTVRFSFEPRLLGGAGGVAAARRLFADGPALVANGDVLADLDLAPLLAAGEPDAVVLAVLPHPDPARWGRVVVAPDGRVTAILAPGEGEAGAHFSGFQLLGAEVVRGLPAPPAEFAPLWRRLAGEGRLRAVTLAGTWQEAGTPVAYRELVVAALGDTSWLHPESRVPADATLTASAVGAGCRLGLGVRLERSVVTAGAAVGGGATLRRCVVAGPVEVPAGTVIDDRLVVPDASLPL